MHKCAMTDSEFWRDPSSHFRSLIHGVFDPVSASWQYRAKSGVAGDWRLQGDASPRLQFEALARRGASKLTNDEGSDLLIAWLEALRKDGTDFHFGPTSTELTDDGSPGTTWIFGDIHGLCEASANYCKKLESAALQAEFEEHQRGERPEPKPEPAAPKLGTIAEQINRLREECHLTAEELAEEVELDSRTVQRHLAGETTPYPRHLRVYERVFFKLLNRQVVIRKMP
jgi:hypothetical protein